MVHPSLDACCISLDSYMLYSGSSSFLEGATSLGEFVLCSEPFQLVSSCDKLLLGALSFNSSARILFEATPGGFMFTTTPVTIRLPVSLLSSVVAFLLWARPSPHSRV